MILEKAVDKLISHIKENADSSKNDGWVTIKYRDVPKITGESSYYTRKIFEALKMHPNIIYEIDTDARTYRKPLKFKYVDEKEKLNPDWFLKKKIFYGLTKEEVEYVKNQTGLDDFEKLYSVLSFINYLALSGGKEDYVEYDEKKVSDELLIPVKIVKEIYNLLKDRLIIIDKGKFVRVILNKQEYEMHLKNEEKGTSSPLIAAEKIDDKRILEIIHKVQEEVKHDIIEDESVISDEHTLVENLRQFRDSIIESQRDFETFLNKQINKILELNKKDEELKKGYETLEKVLQENQKLKEENVRYIAEINDLKRALERARNFKEKFIENAQSRLEVLLAEIIGITNSYTQIPHWKKDQKLNAKFQKNILDAVTSSIDEILHKSTEEE